MAISPQVAVTRDGTLAAIWVGFDGRNLSVHGCTRAVGADRWSVPVLLSDSAAMGANALRWEAEDPPIIATSGGTLGATWSRLDGVWVSTISESDTHWSTPSKLAASCGGPDIVARPDGSLATTWADRVQVSTLRHSSDNPVRSWRTFGALGRDSRLTGYLSRLRESRRRSRRWCLVASGLPPNPRHHGGRHRSRPPWHPFSRAAARCPESPRAATGASRRKRASGSSRPRRSSPSPHPGTHQEPRSSRPGSPTL